MEPGNDQLKAGQKWCHMSKGNGSLTVPLWHLNFGLYDVIIQKDHAMYSRDRVKTFVIFIQHTLYSFLIHARGEKATFLPYLLEINERKNGRRQ